MGALGLAGEGAEVLDIFVRHTEVFLLAAKAATRAGMTADDLKKVVHHQHPVDREKVKKELGDLLWYVALTAHACGLSLNDVAETNVAKLKARYAKGFTTAESLNRKPGDV
jgi:NTP pyrophosphatase (non-canonical NTP hydrolase)